jgi:hypothetical protein
LEVVPPAQLLPYMVQVVPPAQLLPYAPVMPLTSQGPAGARRSVLMAEM